MERKLRPKKDLYGEGDVEIRAVETTTTVNYYGKTMVWYEDLETGDVECLLKVAASSSGNKPH